MSSLRRLAAIFAIAVLATTAACGSDTKTPKAEHAQCTYRDTGRAPAKPVDPPPGNPPKGQPSQVVMSTDRGDVKINLDVAQAPCAVNSFLSLAKQGFFDKTKCHRLVAGGKMALNVLQCGDPTGTSAGDPGYEFDEELVDNDPRLQPCYGQTNPQTGKEYCTYTAGTVAMAKGNAPGTSGSQFFLVYDDSVLDASYTVLGRMSAAGLKVIRSEAAQGVVPGTETPKQSITITSVK